MNKTVIAAAICSVLAVVPLFGGPTLSIRQTGTNAVLAWPAALTSFTLEQSSNMLGSWQGTLEAQVVDNGENTVVQALAPAKRFFRLNLTSPDRPDPLGLDSDGDGIDGAISDAVFVTVPPLGDDRNPGTPTQPVATLERGISLASSANPRKDVYVGRGTYSRSGTLDLASGVSLYGQFDGTTNWVRAANNTTIISGAATRNSQEPQQRQGRE